MKDEALVVIAGWLGCQERFLNRYVTTYRQLGIATFLVIPPPLAVVEATFQRTSQIQMELVALQVLRHIEENRPQQLLFHLFSNGGCFLWEKIRHLMETDRRYSVSVDGVIFDSCPAWFGDQQSPLSSALDLCSEQDKQAIRDRFSAGIGESETSHLTQLRRHRSQDFFRSLERDGLDVPQLYLYCTNDPLAEYSRIQKLIASRRRRFDRPILEKQWTVSVHCFHILQHSQEYQELLANFLKVALGRSKL